MFEIVLKQDYEDIFFYREFEVNGITANSPGLSPDQNSRSQSRSRTPKKYSPSASYIVNSDGTKVYMQSPKRSDSPS